MMSFYWEVFWFFLPAGIANMAPIFATRIPLLRRWNTPLDFGASYRSIRIFGNNKTWRGLLFGVFCAVLTGLFQYRFIAYGAESLTFIVTSSAALGFGALAGDAIESFFKRQRNIPAGESWFPFDQTDYIVGGLIAVWPFIPRQLTFDIIAGTLFIYTSLHLIFSYIGFRFGLKKKPI
jgi:CDP-2,3-bis-(O-geranylgeranyl)-sn-glycerol synthase